MGHVGHYWPRKPRVSVLEVIDALNLDISGFEREVLRALDAYDPDGATRVRVQGKPHRRRLPGALAEVLGRDTIADNTEP